MRKAWLERSDPAAPERPFRCVLRYERLLEKRKRWSAEDIAELDDGTAGAFLRREQGESSNAPSRPPSHQSTPAGEKSGKNSGEKSGAASGRTSARAAADEAAAAETREAVYPKVGDCF